MVEGKMKEKEKEKEKEGVMVEVILVEDQEKMGRGLYNAYGPTPSPCPITDLRLGNPAARHPIGVTQ